jgi:hypothetical protein
VARTLTWSFSAIVLPLLAGYLERRIIREAGKARERRDAKAKTQKLKAVA